MVKKILVSQPQPATGKSPYSDIEREFGVECIFRPFFKVEGVASKDFRNQRVNLLDYQAVIFTSRHAIDNYFRLAKEMRINIPETMKYFCTIEAIALYIQKYVQYRKRKVFFGTTGKIESLLPQLLKNKDCKFLVPLSAANDGKIAELLTANNLQYKECTMYDTVSNDFTEQEKAEFNYDAMIFFSPTGVGALRKNFPDFTQNDIKIGAFGSATAKQVADEGLRLDFSAPSPECPSMTAALKHYLQQLNDANLS